MIQNKHLNQVFSGKVDKKKSREALFTLASLDGLKK